MFSRDESGNALLAVVFVMMLVCGSSLFLIDFVLQMSSQSARSQTMSAGNLLEINIRRQARLGMTLWESIQIDRQGHRVSAESTSKQPDLMNPALFRCLIDDSVFDKGAPTTGDCAYTGSLPFVPVALYSDETDGNQIRLIAGAIGGRAALYTTRGERCTRESDLQCIYRVTAAFAPVCAGQEAGFTDPTRLPSASFACNQATRLVLKIKIEPLPEFNFLGTREVFETVRVPSTGRWAITRPAIAPPPPAPPVAVDAVVLARVGDGNAPMSEITESLPSDGGGAFADASASRASAAAAPVEVAPAPRPPPVNSGCGSGRVASGGGCASFPL